MSAKREVDRDVASQDSSTPVSTVAAGAGTVLSPKMAASSALINGHVSTRGASISNGSHSAAAGALLKTPLGHQLHRDELVRLMLQQLQSMGYRSDVQYLRITARCVHVER